MRREVGEGEENDTDENPPTSAFRILVRKS